MGFCLRDPRHVRLQLSILIFRFSAFQSALFTFFRAWILLVWPIATLLVPFARATVRHLLCRVRLWQRGVAVLGAGKHYDAIERVLFRDSYSGYYFAYHSPLQYGEHEALDHLASRLLREFQLRGADHAILVPIAAEMKHVDRVIDALNLAMIRYILIPPLQNVPYSGLTVHPLLKTDALMMTAQSGLMSPFRQAIKTIFDFTVALTAVIVLSPALLLIAGLVATTGFPIVYGHRRIGRGNKPFDCYKFRTMVVNSQEVLQDLLANDPVAAKEWAMNFKLTKDPRITKVGAFLRKTSLDELPQLFNVLKGEMSLVGPRPVVAQELQRYYGEGAYFYHLVKPGVTGLWQVSGRSSTSYEQRVWLDTYYVRNWNLWMDLAIMCGTVPSVLVGKGAQ